MAPIPGMIREPARFENQYDIDWTGYGPYTKIITTDTYTSYSKLENYGLQGWPLLPVVTVSVLFALIVVGIVAHFCFWGRRSYPQTASSEDKMKMEDTKERRSDGWMCFILACHAVITLGVV